MQRQIARLAVLTAIGTMPIELGAQRPNVVVIMADDLGCFASRGADS